MKKILIGAILTSSLAMSGDLEKCSHAIDMTGKYSTLASTSVTNMQESIIKTRHLKLKLSKTGGTSKEIKEEIEDSEYYTFVTTQGTNAYKSLYSQWSKKGTIVCKGILDQEGSKYFFGK